MPKLCPECGKPLIYDRSEMWWACSDITHKALSAVEYNSLPSIIDKTLIERGSRYGKFEDHAEIAQGFQNVMRHPPDGNMCYPDATCLRAGWVRLAHDQRQALTVIADKIARILNGDPNYIDNWHDIQGYAKLVEDRLLADIDRQKTELVDKLRPE